MDLEGIIPALEACSVPSCPPRLFFLSDSELVALLAAPLESCEAQLWARHCFPHVRSPTRSVETAKTDDPESSPSMQTQVVVLAGPGAGGEEMKLRGSLLLCIDLPKWLASLEESLRLALVHNLGGLRGCRLALGPSLDKAFKQENHLPQESQIAPTVLCPALAGLGQRSVAVCVGGGGGMAGFGMEEALLEGRTWPAWSTCMCAS